LLRAPSLRSPCWAQAAARKARQQAAAVQGGCAAEARAFCAGMSCRLILASAGMNQLRILFQFLKENDLRSILAALSRRDVHPVIQFFKYGLCGVCAFIVHGTAFYLSARYFIPGLEQNCPDQWERAKASLANNGIALIFSNMMAYWLNTKWVFTQGRHSLVREFLFFTLVNMPGAICGGLVSYFITAKLGWPVWCAFAGFVLPNVLVNFACRKFFIFKK
jgi:putative flippase GtrA